MELRGCNALITGASKGLGAALAFELARTGANLVLAARGEAALLQTRDAVRRAFGGQVHAWAMDVGDKDAIYPVAGASAALAGPIDLLVHSASTLGPLPMPLLLDTACEDFARVLDVNLLGPFRLTKAVVGAMVLRRRGVVVFVSSDAAVSPYAHWGAYGVSKAALDHLARTLAVELEGTHVQFFSVDPGEMDTQMHADALPDADRTKLTDPAAVARRIVRMIEQADRLAPGARIEAASWTQESTAGGR